MLFASNGGETPGWPAAPEGQPGGGVVVIQEWWGSATT
jgi:dienelactone hydrolase